MLDVQDSNSKASNYLASWYTVDSTATVVILVIFAAISAQPQIPGLACGCESFERLSDLAMWWSSPLGRAVYV